MGEINCCKKPEEELVVDTLETIETIKEEKIITNIKDKYPHDSDSAFKNRNNQELKTEFKTISTDRDLE